MRRRLDEAAVCGAQRALGGLPLSGARLRQLGHTAQRSPIVKATRLASAYRRTTVQIGGGAERCSTARSNGMYLRFTSRIASRDVSAPTRYQAACRQGCAAGRASFLGQTPERLARDGYHDGPPGEGYHGASA